jgi:tight adherence protein B
MDVLALLASVSVMGTVLAIGVGIYASRLSVGTQIRARLEGVLAGTSAVEGTQVDSALRERRGIASGIIASFISGEWLQKLAADLERADMTIRPVEYIATRLALAVLGFLIPYVLLGPSAVGMLSALAGVVAGFFLPALYVNHRRNSRVQKLDAQLPEALTLISNSLKAGFGLLQSLDLAARQMDHPISTELNRTIYEMSVGSNPEDALLALGKRSDSYDLDIVVTAILIQRAAGGNLAEILDTVAETMRDRARIRGEIKTLTAQQKMTGLVIGTLPLGVVGMFMLTSPDYIMVLFTTTMGKAMLGLAVGLEVVGLLIIQRILSIEL